MIFLILFLFQNIFYAAVKKDADQLIHELNKQNSLKYRENLIISLALVVCGGSCLILPHCAMTKNRIDISSSQLKVMNIFGASLLSLGSHLFFFNQVNNANVKKNFSILPTALAASAAIVHSENLLNLNEDSLAKTISMMSTMLIPMLSIMINLIISFNKAQENIVRCYTDWG